jgi:membrane-associated protein
MEEQLIGWIGRFSYPAVYALLVSSGIGAPVSEDLVLLTAGVVAAGGRAEVWLMAAVAWAGVFTSDTLLFRIGARLGPKIIEHPRLGRVLTEARVGWLRAKFQRYGAWTVFAARFLPGLRAPTFLLAGSMGVTQRRFWLADGCAALLFAPALVTLGASFGPDVLPVLRAVGGWLVTGVLLALAVAIAARRLRR